MPWEAYARHILDTMEKIRRIRERGDPLEDTVLYDAALRNLQTLSEAAQHLPQHLKREYPDIPWRQIGDFRNILVHNYLGDIDPQTVLGVVRKDLPPLEAAVRAMLSEGRTGVD